MLLVILLTIVFLFGLGAILGAPYLPTRKRQAEAALDLLQLRPGETVIDLGSGDGGFLTASARRGIRAVGYEINPLLVIYSKLATLKYRRLIKIKWANFWTIRLPEADGIYVFLISRYMSKLHKKIRTEAKRPVKVASYTFRIPTKRAVKQKDAVFLYRY